MNEHEHPLSWQALGRIVTVALAVYIAWQAINVLVMILIALIFATAIYPIVRSFHRHMSIIASATVVLIIFLIPATLFGYFILPNLVKETPDLLKTFYGIISQISFLPETIKNFDVSQYFSENTSSLFNYTKLALSGLLETVTIFFMTFYFVIDHERLLGIFLDLFPKNERKKISGMLDEVAQVNGKYIRGNLVISIICTVFIFVGLLLLHVPYALPLAIFAGVLDLLPLVGSFLGAVPAIIFAFAISPSTGIFVIALNLFYQQLENAVISPAIYNKALNISSALSFLAVVVGGGLFGVLGAFLALPLAASIPVMLRYLHDYSERNA
ncbi:MAG: AI-2E family transporter [Patescibacteria group bacterium]